MNPELKQKWLKALRSGRYKQTIEYLHTDDGYCCLGVLGSVAKKGKWEEDRNYSGDKFYTFVPFKKYEEEFGGVEEFSGDFEEYCKVFGLTPKQQTTLIDMNDHKNNNFEQIADYIEKYL